LIIAIQKQDVDMAKFLLKFGADLYKEITFRKVDQNTRIASEEKTTPYQILKMLSPENPKIAQIQKIIETYDSNSDLREDRGEETAGGGGGGGGGDKSSLASSTEKKSFSMYCCAGSLDFIQKALAERVDPNQTDKDGILKGVTPLWASCVGSGIDVNLNIIRVLLRSKADPNKSNEAGKHTGEYPLVVSSHCGHTEIVKLLLNEGASPDQSNEAGSSMKGVTPLYIASECGSTEIVDLLLNKKASPDKATPEGVTPLYIASQGNLKDIVKLLLTSKADANKSNEDGLYAGLPPLYSASSHDYLEVVKLLVDEKANPYQVIENQGNNTTPLRISYKRNHVAIFDLLIQQRASIFDMETFLCFMEKNKKNEHKELNKIYGGRIKLLENSASKIAVFYRGCKQKQKFKEAQIEAQIEAHEVIRRFVFERKLRGRGRVLRRLRAQIGYSTVTAAYQEILKIIRDATSKLTPRAVKKAQQRVDQYFSLSLHTSNEMQKEIACLRAQLKAAQVQLHKKHVAEERSGINNNQPLVVQGVRGSRGFQELRRSSSSSDSDEEGAAASASASASEDVKPTLYELENQEKIEDQGRQHNLSKALKARLEAIKIEPSYPSVGDVQKTQLEEDKLPIYRVKINKQYRLFYAIDETNKKVILLSLCDHDEYDLVYKNKGK